MGTRRATKEETIEVLRAIARGEHGERCDCLPPDTPSDLLAQWHHAVRMMVDAFPIEQAATLLVLNVTEE